MSIIQLKNVSKTYCKDNEKINAIKNATISFEKGRFYAIMGSSGAGKSTFLQCIGLLDEITSGEILINGKDSTKLTDEEISKIRKDNIGFVFQSYYLNPIMKAYENVMIPLYLNNSMSKDDRKSKANNLLKIVDMEKRANHYPKELSGGEQQRVAIARALANDPDIILADEPTGNLDSNNETKIFKILKDLSSAGKCIIVVSHNPEIKKYADIVHQMKDGEIL